MAELGEPVAVGIIADEDWKCPFEHKKPGKVQNVLTASGGAELGDGLKNGWSTQIWAEEGDEIKPKKQQVLQPPTPDSTCPSPPVTVDMQDGQGTTRDFPFSKSAHHLIPAKQALAKSSLMSYIKDGSTIDGDIGYDVNGAENGLWMPTHAALSQGGVSLPGATSNSRYSALSHEGSDSAANFVDLYTEAVMDKTGRQFHDSHPDYGNFVIKVLEKIKVNLADISNFHCPDCKEAKSHGGKLPPPHTLVFRLNAVSTRLKGFLLGGPLNWKDPLFTSPHAKSYADIARKRRDRGI